MMSPSKPKDIIQGSARVIDIKRLTEPPDWTKEINLIQQLGAYQKQITGMGEGVRAEGSTTRPTRISWSDGHKMADRAPGLDKGNSFNTATRCLQKQIMGVGEGGRAEGSTT